MIAQDRSLENDKDIAPYQFFRKGTREYVFPSQEVVLQSDISEVITPQEGYPGHPDTAGYGIRTEVQNFTYDEALVKGRLRVEYHDAGDKPELTVTYQENSELPREVTKTLEEIFK